MRDRRQDFRHTFDLARRLMVQCTSLRDREPGSVIGEILNISVGGLCIQAEALASLGIDQWMASYVLEPGTQPVRAAVTRIYTGLTDPTVAGFQFLPTSNALAEEERERRIWRFLMAEQRRERQRRLARAVADLALRR
jgi:hypothetical protein